MNGQGTNPRFIVAMVVILVVIVAGLLFYSLNLNQKNAQLQKQTQQAGGPATAGIVRDGVFLSFSATAQGKVTKVTDDSIEIESEGVKKSFKLSPTVFVTHNFSFDSLFKQITDRLIGTVHAQTATASPRPSQPTAPVAAPASSILPPAPPIATSGGKQFVQKSIKDVKTGATVMLNLTKQREADEWVVTSIFIQP